MELSLYDMVGGDILEPGGHSAHGGRLHGYSAKRFFSVFGPYYTLVKKFGIMIFFKSCPNMYAALPNLPRECMKVVAKLKK